MQFKPIAVIIVLSLVVASLLVAGCTSSTQNTNTQSGQSNNSVSISAQAVQSPPQIMSGSLPINPATGNKFVMFNVTFTNINAPSLSVYNRYFTVQDTNNNTYPMANFNQDLVTKHFPASTTTNPGMKVNGVIVYDVPQNAKLVTMTYDDSNIASVVGRTPIHIVIKI